MAESAARSRETVAAATGCPASLCRSPRIFEVGWAAAVSTVSNRIIDRDSDLIVSIKAANMLYGFYIATDLLDKRKKFAVKGLPPGKKPGASVVSAPFMQRCRIALSPLSEQPD
jgi:hypothetical protein